MWPILTLLLALLYLVSLKVQQDQKKEIETLKTINEMLRNTLRNKM